MNKFCSRLYGNYSERYFANTSRFIRFIPFPGSLFWLNRYTLKVAWNRQSEKSVFNCLSQLGAATVECLKGLNSFHRVFGW